MTARGAARRLRFIEWHGPMVQPGHGLEFPRGLWVVTRVELPKHGRPTRTVFWAHVVRLGGADPRPAVVHPCYRAPRR